jgi:hypothetical protein
MSKIEHGSLLPHSSAPPRFRYASKTDRPASAASRRLQVYCSQEPPAFHLAVSSLEAEESKVLVAELGAAIRSEALHAFSTSVDHLNASLMSCSNYAKQLLQQSDHISIDSSDRGLGRYPEILKMLAPL